MYDPRAPNSYDLVAKKRAADDAERAKAAQQLKAAAQVEAEQARILAAAALVAKPAGDTTVEDIKRHRLAMSASLGNAAAIEMQRDEHEASVKERKALGLDSGSKGSRFLAKLGVKEGQSVSGDGEGLANHLVNMKTGMAAGGSVLVPMAAAPAKPAVKGRPSATLLIRNAAAEASEELRMDVQSECANYGTVRATKVHQLDPATGSWAPSELVRVFVRFDNVASAFKAAENLSGRSYQGRQITVSFFPTALFENNSLDPTPDEERLM